MKRFITNAALWLIILTTPLLGQGLSPFYQLKTFDGSVQQAASSIEQTLTGAGYQVLGAYHPENKNSLYVICFTNEKLKALSTRFKDRGALGAVLRIGFVEKNGKTTVSATNPTFVFYAYWGKQMGDNEQEVKSMAGNIMALYQSIGTPEPFGGSIDKDELPEYHYKIMMPYFDDPDELESYDSFQEGLSIIRKRLAQKTGNTTKVFELVIPEKKIAVFGVGLLDPEIGEGHFLPIIGESHIAAMPYEIILQGKEATALAGKYRFALYWPELSMSEFMKIMSTPGDVEDMLEAICEED